MARAPKPMAPAAPKVDPHAAEMARRAKNRAAAAQADALAKKAHDAEIARRMNNRLGRGKKG